MTVFHKFVLFVLLSLLTAGLVTACGTQYSSTDVVSFTNINTFLTDEDRAKGNRKTYAEMPAVKLSHLKHERAGVKCIKCHHKKYNDSRLKRCNHCHNGIKGVEDMHKYCMGCHEKMNGPLDCASCHPPEKEKLDITKTTSDYDPKKIFTTEYHDYHKTVQCQTCHHKEKGTRDLKKCTACHSDDVPRMRIMHFFCRDCHDKQKKGPLTCTSCHR